MPPSHHISKQSKSNALASEGQRHYDRIPAIIMALDVEGRIVQWNQFAAEEFGLSLEELTGQLFWERLTAERWWEATRKRFEALISGEGAFEMELEMQCQSGALRNVLWSVSLVVDEDDVVRGMTWCGMDITQRMQRAEQELLRERRLLEAYIDNVPDHIYFKDLESRFILINRSTAEHQGWEDPAMAVGKTDYDIFSQEHADHAYADEQKIIQTGEPMVYQREKLTWPDGRVSYVTTTKMPLRGGEGNIIGTFGVSRDVTEEVEDERERDHLTDQLKERNHDLLQFAYVVSHDLQEPLRAVTSFSELLEQEYGDQLDDTARRYIEFLTKESQRMRLLIQDLLLYSRAGSQPEKFVATPLEEVLNAASGALHQLIVESGAVIKHDALPVVVGDPTRLEQLFQNLLSNAIKFVSGRTPEVEVKAERVNHAWHITIRDNGIGIEQKHMDRVFDVFKRLHGRDEYPGTGIGLSICKRIVQDHGGRIWIESEPGAGTVCHFTLACDLRGVIDTRVDDLDENPGGQRGTP